MLQRSNVRAVSSRPGLGKYVNRLGWAVSSEEQRLAALGKIEEYAQGPNGNEGLEYLVTKIKAMTSLVQNPEGAIDTGESMGMRLNATYQELLMSYNLTRDGGLSEEAARRGLANAMFVLMSDKNITDLHAIAGKAGLNLVDYVDLLDGGKTYNNSILVRDILSRNDQFSQQLIDLIDISTENTGAALIANTSKQMGMIRALQEIYTDDIDFGGIGKVGFDDLATNLKLAGIVDEMRHR